MQLTWTAWVSFLCSGCHWQKWGFLGNKKFDVSGIRMGRKWLKVGRVGCQGAFENSRPNVTWKKEWRIMINCLIGVAELERPLQTLRSTSPFTDEEIQDPEG